MKQKVVITENALPQGTRKILNKQPNINLKELQKEQMKPKVIKEGNNTY